jgi:hypothetical protein
VDVTYEQANEKLVEALPELAEAYRKQVEWWGNEKPRQHVVYGLILNPYLDRLLQDSNEADLRRVFAFLEHLSVNPDPHVQELVSFTVCEHLGGDLEKLRQARHYMGPATLKLSGEADKFWKG